MAESPKARGRTDRAAKLRQSAFAEAEALIESLPLPPDTALAATGSFARREMTPRSDVDLLLVHGESTTVDPAELSRLWEPVWAANYHLDYAVRTPRECAAIARADATAGFALLDLGYAAGKKQLVDEARAKFLAAWRRQLQGNFDQFLDSSIARWRRSGAVAVMTNPDLKNGRGGLRDIQLLRALSLGNLCDMPDLRAEKELLLDVRTLLHVHARRRRDILDPEFAADIAVELGYPDRYRLNAALVQAATSVDKALERGLAMARGIVGKRYTPSPRRPLDVDVVEAEGEITLSRRPNLSDPWLLTRVAAAAARTGKRVAETTWSQLQALPPLPPRWPKAAVDDFFAILSSPQHTPRVIRELDERGLWEQLVPEWPRIRGLLPRERNHIHSVDYHLVDTVARCASARTTVARPDLLLLTALYHDIGKGQVVPHAQLGAQMVAAQARRMGLKPIDCARAQAVVAQHSAMSQLAARRDPHSPDTHAALADAAGYDPLVLSLLAVLSRADAQATGPGVWTPRLAAAIEAMSQGALASLNPGHAERPDIGDIPQVRLLVDWQEQQITVEWCGEKQAESHRMLALIAALGWTIVASAVVRKPEGSYAGKFWIRTVQQTLADAADNARFLQSYKSGTYRHLPEISGEPTTAEFGPGGVLEVRTVERVGALGHLYSVLPECEWVSQEILGATMIVSIYPRGEVDRRKLVADVTRALVKR